MENDNDILDSAIKDYLAASQQAVTTPSTSGTTIGSCTIPTGTVSTTSTGLWGSGYGNGGFLTTRKPSSNPFLRKANPELATLPAPMLTFLLDLLRWVFLEHPKAFSSLNGTSLSLQASVITDKATTNLTVEVPHLYGHYMAIKEAQSAPLTMAKEDQLAELYVLAMYILETEADS